MQINFYEEFPTKENLEKLRLIKWKTKIFVTAKSKEGFAVLEKQIKKIKKDTEVAYWPIAPKTYWISPFSKTEDLEKLFSELNKTKCSLLIDLELPLRENRILLIKNIFRLKKNKKIIKDFLERNKSRVTTAEYPFTIPKRVMKWLGLSYEIGYERNIMWYSSMLPRLLNNIIKKKLNKIENKNNYSISLGTIATGVLGNEPILSPEILERDLEFVEKAGFEKVIIFRLGGLNKDYIEGIEKFAK